MKKRRITLKTITCLGEDIHFVIDRLEDLGIVFADQILRLRVYDLLNMNRIDAEAARATIHMLYRVFNPNTLIDEGLEDRTIDQQFPFAIWRKKYPDLSVVTGDVSVRVSVVGSASAPQAMIL